VPSCKADAAVAERPSLLWDSACDCIHLLPSLLPLLPLLLLLPELRLASLLPLRLPALLSSLVRATAVGTRCADCLNSHLLLVKLPPLLLLRPALLL
jgi:hypothetical protein